MSRSAGLLMINVLMTISVFDPVTTDLRACNKSYVLNVTRDQWGQLDHDLPVKIIPVDRKNLCVNYCQAPPVSVWSKLLDCLQFVAIRYKSDMKT